MYCISQGTEEEEEEETTISAETSFTAGDQDFSLSNSSINNEPARSTFKPLVIPSNKSTTNDTSMSSSADRNSFTTNYEKGLCESMSSKHISPICIKPKPLRKLNVDCIAPLGTSPTSDPDIIHDPDPVALLPKEGPVKMARVSKSYHGKSQSANTCLAFRRASEGLSINTSGSPLESEKQIEASRSRGRDSPKVSSKSSQESVGVGGSPKRSSRFTTTPVSESVFSLKPQASPSVASGTPSERLNSPKVTMSTDIVIAQGFKINSNTP